MSGERIISSPLATEGVMTLSAGHVGEDGEQGPSVILCHPSDADVAQWIAEGGDLTYDQWKDSRDA